MLNYIGMLVTKLLTQMELGCVFVPLEEKILASKQQLAQMNQSKIWLNDSLIIEGT